jgi:putative transposase
MQRIQYPSDLSDQEWHWIAPVLPTTAKPGRPRKYPRREILNALFYLIRTGGQWRGLPHDFPKWKTVHHYFRVWSQSGVWATLKEALRKRGRVALGRETPPSAGIIDSQSVKPPGVGGARGSEGAKKITGRKRPLLVDTQGLVLKCTVPTADVRDREGVRLL